MSRRCLWVLPNRISSLETTLKSSLLFQSVQRVSLTHTHTHTSSISSHRETFRMSLPSSHSLSLSFALFHCHSVNTAHTAFRYVVKKPIIQSVARYIVYVHLHHSHGVVDVDINIYPPFLLRSSKNIATFPRYYFPDSMFLPEIFYRILLLRDRRYLISNITYTVVYITRIHNRNVLYNKYLIL